MQKLRKLYIIRDAKVKEALYHFIRSIKYIDWIIIPNHRSDKRKERRNEWIGAERVIQ